MDGIAPARELITPARRHAVRSAIAGDAVAVGPAGREDDDAIRRLLREHVFPGRIRLTLEREPDSFAAAAVEGEEHETLVARDRASGRIVACAARSVRDVYVNGRPARVGYLGQLRMEAAFRRRALLDEGFARWRTPRQPSDPPCYLVSVVAENAAARRMLERRRPGWPALQPLEPFVTLAIPVGGARRRSSGGGASLGCASGREVGSAALVECLARGHRRQQFAPCWTEADLQSARRTPNLGPDDFVVVSRDGRPGGSVACWDQRPFKQVVVRGYSQPLSLARPALNLMSGLLGTPRLPAVGSRLELVYLSHLAMEDDDPGVFEALVSEGCRLARGKGAGIVALGLSARSPLLAHATKSFAHRAYESMLYVAFWPEGAGFVQELDGRPSNPELALL